MANPNFWYARRYKDYAEKTAHLSLIEHGAYTLLLDHYYESRSKSQAFALANGVANLSALFRVCRSQADDERDAVRSVVAQFFQPGADGYLHNNSADRELAKAANVSVARSAAGKEGAERKKEKSKSQAIDAAIAKANEQAKAEANAVANAQQTATQPQTHIQTQPESQQQATDTTSTATASAPTSGTVPAAKERRKEKRTPVESQTAETWNAYCEAYRARYRVDPVRNATTNAQMKNFVIRLGVDESPHVARFYVAHNKSWYVQQSHAIGPMLSDAEGLRTQWATGNRVTAARAQQMDRTQTNGDVFAVLIAEAEERERNGE